MKAEEVCKEMGEKTFLVSHITEEEYTIIKVTLTNEELSHNCLGEEFDFDQDERYPVFTFVNRDIYMTTVDFMSVGDILAIDGRELTITRLK